MKKNILLQLILVILFSLVFNSLSAQTSSERVKNEIREMLTQWNIAAKSANVEQAVSLFDSSENIMLVGSDSGEIFKGKDQIKGWLTLLFKHNSFYWEMDRIDIDNNNETAWVFMDGSMIVANDKGKSFKRPYRFTGIMVKKENIWKWRLFDGSIPKQE